VPTTKFLSQGFEKVEHEQDRQTDTDTDRRDWVHYHVAFTVSNKPLTSQEVCGHKQPAAMLHALLVTVFLSVCLSVCPSHADMVSKEWMKHYAVFTVGRLNGWLYFLD